jgi:hypothetical protein
VAPLLEPALAEFQKDGVANAREIHAAMLREIALHTKG